MNTMCIMQSDKILSRLLNVLESRAKLDRNTLSLDNVVDFQRAVIMCKLSETIVVDYSLMYTLLACERELPPVLDENQHSTLLYQSLEAIVTDMLRLATNYTTLMNTTVEMFANEIQTVLNTHKENQNGNNSSKI